LAGAGSEKLKQQLDRNTRSNFGETAVRRSFCLGSNQAIPIAVGLGVNLLSAFLLRDDHDHHHRARHAYDDHDPAHVHRDHNLRADFVHVAADAVVSVFVIVGLVAGTANAF
jgi:Co/Zn/Cd efflux system component